MITNEEIDKIIDSDKIDFVFSESANPMYATLLIPNNAKFLDTVYPKKGSGRIHISKKALKLPKELFIAILLHEVGHLKLNHLWVKKYKVLLHSYFDSIVLSTKKEIEADTFVYEKGYGKLILDFLKETRIDNRRFIKNTKDKFYLEAFFVSIDGMLGARIKNLTKLLKERKT